MEKEKIMNVCLEAFTIVEVLVTLALTSIVITLSYTALTYTQKLFSSYKAQNKFITQYTDFKKRMDYESAKATIVDEVSENTFQIRRDSSTAVLQILEKVILLKRNERCDTFHIAAKNIMKTFEPMSNPLWTNKLISTLQFETEFSKQKFSFSFNKRYDAAVKLALNQTN